MEGFMVIRSVVLVLLIGTLVTAISGQQTFEPRSGAEAQAWRFYEQFKQSKANEARLKTAITQAKGDYSDISYGSLGGLAGIITGDASDLANLRKELAIELALQHDLLEIWRQTFFWRYGELLDIDKPKRDEKTGRMMDRVEFAIRYFPFYRDKVESSKNSVVAEKGSADAWSHLRVSISNVADFKTVDSPGWRNNGTRFTARASGSGRIPVRVEIIGKGGVSYQDYEYSVSARTLAGVRVMSDGGKLSREGGMKTFNFEWDPVAAPGSLSIVVNIGGGNPESFIYYVSGSIDGPK